MVDGIKPLLSVVDTLHLGFYIRSFRLAEEDFSYLEERKRWAKETGIGSSEVLVEFKGKCFKITSARKLYAFVLYNDDITVKIARQVSNGVYPEVFIEFRSRFLLGGLKDAYLLVREWVEKWAEIESEKVSRADIATDYQGELTLNLDAVVMRCRSNVEHFDVYRDGRTLTGYTFGAGDLLLRIYNKTTEIEKSGKEYIKFEWKRQGWDGISPVWRVEGQLRRQMVKEFQIETVQDLIDSASDVWRYLTGEWFTVREPSETDTTRSRWPLSAVWETVHISFIAFGELTGVVRERIKKATVEKLLPQAAGLLTSISALMKKGTIDFQDLFRMMRWHYKKKGTKIDEVILEKMRRYALFEEALSAITET